MSQQFRFSNLCGTVYRCGSILFTPDGNKLLSPVGNRITVFDLIAHSSFTLPVETRKNIDKLAISHSGRLVVAVDVDGRALVINLPRRTVLHRFNFKSRVRAVSFSPDDSLLAVAAGRRLQLWRTPAVRRQVAPLVHHRTYGGHLDDITCIDWSPCGRYLLTGSKDATAKIFTAYPTRGFVPITLSGHRDQIVSAQFAEAPGVIYTVARDAAAFTWRWEEREAIDLPEQASDDDSEGSGSDSDSDSGSSDSSDSNSSDSDSSDSSDSEAEEDGEEAEEEAEGEAAGRATGKRPRGPASLNHAAGRAGAGIRSAVGGRRQRERRLFADPAAAGSARGTLLEADELGLSVLSANYSVAFGEWVLDSRHVFKMEGPVRVRSATIHRDANLLVVGFSSGVFGLYTLPDFANLHTLSISKATIDTVAVNASGEWLAFGIAGLGQLLVWEWQSETYVLKQQGHFHDLNCLAYSPDGQVIATGGDDGKIKLWSTRTGFCFVTFGDHTAPVSALEFMGGRGGRGQSIVSASLDGTIRCYDLVRYRNFRTMKPPLPCQFMSLAVDPSGEVVVAGAMDPFDIFVFNVRTGELMDQLAGHEGPVAALAFSPASAQVASASWDCTCRVWDIFRKGDSVESFSHSSDALAVAFRPDGKEVCVSTRDGRLSFWNVKDGRMTRQIEGRRDVAGGRSKLDARTAQSTAAGKCFTSLAYTADGECVIAGGRSKFVCIYAVESGLLLKKFQLSHNRSLDGMLDKLNSKDLGEDGVARDMIDTGYGSDDDRDRMADPSLPGVKRGDLTARRVPPEIRSKCVRFSPTGTAWGAASTEGLLLFSLDEDLVFDPFELDLSVTPENVERLIRQGKTGDALLMSLHLNETSIIARAQAAVAERDIPLAAAALPLTFVPRMLAFVASRLRESRELEYHCMWALSLLQLHGRALKSRARVSAGPLRDLVRSVGRHSDTIGRTTTANLDMLSFLAAGDPADAVGHGAAAAAAAGGGGGAAASGASGATALGSPGFRDALMDGAVDHDDFEGERGAEEAKAVAAAEVAEPGRQQGQKQGKKQGQKQGKKQGKKKAKKQKKNRKEGPASQKA